MDHLSAKDKELKFHLINKYRALIAQRYTYDAIKDNPDVPSDITQGVVDALRYYFLEDLYPEPVQREKLDAAFKQLGHYVTQPAKVWGLLGNITLAIIRFGRQFPTALRAGLTALEAHNSANKFENTLLRGAIERGFSIPVSDEQFLHCITDLPFQQVESFILDLERLFAAFTNTQLLGKTISIMQGVLAEMKKKDHLYGPTEVEAIRLGLNIMQTGYDLFKDYDEQLKKDILFFVTSSERKFLKEIYAGHAGD